MGTGQPLPTRAAMVLADLLKATGDSPALSDQEKAELRRTILARLKEKR